MKFFSLEHSPIAYAADFVAYPTAIFAGLCAVLIYTPMTRWPSLAFVFLLGILAWTLIEYMLHRLVLHGLQPFKRWHEEHHKRPHALIGTSTPASMLLFVILWWFARKPRPVGAVSGVFLIGYGILRFIAEYFREPDSHLGLLSLGLSMGQWLCIPMVLAGVLLWIWAARRTVQLAPGR